MKTKLEFTEEQIAEAERKIRDPNITVKDLISEFAKTLSKQPSSISNKTKQNDK